MGLLADSHPIAPGRRGEGTPAARSLCSLAMVRCDVAPQIPDPIIRGPFRTKSKFIMDTYTLSPKKNRDAQISRCHRSLSNERLTYTVEKFWQRFEEGENGCLIWMGSNQFRRGRVGYGTLHFGGKTWASHRLAYTLTYSPIPRGKVVRHICDNPPCRRPDHLALGSQ